MRRATETEEFLERLLQLFQPLTRVLVRLCHTLSRIAFVSARLKTFSGVWSWLWNEPLAQGEVLGYSQRAYSLRVFFALYLMVVTLVSVVLGGAHLLSKPAMVIINELPPISNLYVPIQQDRLETDNPPDAKTNLPLWQKNQFGQGFIGFVRLIPVAHKQLILDIASPIYALGEDNQYDSTKGDGTEIHPVPSEGKLMHQLDQLESQALTITPPPSPLLPLTDWESLISQGRQGVISNIEPPVVSPDTTLVSRFADSLGLTELFALLQLRINEYGWYNGIQVIQEIPPNIGVGAIVKQALLNGSCRPAKQCDSLGCTNVPAIRYFSYTITNERIGGYYTTGDPSYLKIVPNKKVPSR